MQKIGIFTANASKQLNFFRDSFSLSQKQVLTKLAGMSKKQQWVWNIKDHMPPQPMKLVQIWKEMIVRRCLVSRELGPSSVIALTLWLACGLSVFQAGEDT